jgi:hypothetical protein
MSDVTSAGALSSTVWSCKDSSVRFTTRLRPSLTLSSLNKDATRPPISHFGRPNTIIRSKVFAMRVFVDCYQRRQRNLSAKGARRYTVLSALQIARRQAGPSGRVRPQTRRGHGHACDRRRADATGASTRSRLRGARNNWSQILAVELVQIEGPRRRGIPECSCRT